MKLLLDYDSIKVNNLSVCFRSQSPGSVESKTALKSTHIKSEHIFNFDFSRILSYNTWSQQ